MFIDAILLFISQEDNLTILKPYFNFPLFIIVVFW